MLAAMRNVSALSLVTACLMLPAVAQSAELDTEHLFAFTIGSDVGERGEKEIETSSLGRFGKRRGSYAATSHAVEFEYVPLENLRLSGGPAFGFYNIRGVDDLDDRRQGAFQGLSFEMRYRLAERKDGWFGVAVGIEPRWSRADEVSGAPVDQYGTELVLAIDRELIPERLVAAANLLWEPEWSRSRTTGEWSRESTLGVTSALMARIAPGVFLGAEARYLRAYDSIGFGRFEGHAFFLGPTLFATLSEKSWLSVGWSPQIAGRAVDDGGTLDLTHFERHQVKVNFGVNF
jgi:hypothetical protein